MPSSARAGLPWLVSSRETPASSSSVGITSVTCMNWRRTLPVSLMRAGHEAMKLTRRPPPPV